jgi:DNA-binding MarR family transcriptional regulator
VNEAVSLNLNPSANPAPLWPSAEKLLRDGDSKQPEAALLRIANNAVLVGWTEDDLYVALMYSAHAGGASVRKHAEPRQLVHRLWRLADAGMREFAELQTPIVEKAARTLWTGVQGRTDRAVLDAMLSLQRHAREEEFGASARQVAEQAGVDKETASRSIGRLCDERSPGGPWVERTSTGSRGRGSRYVFVPQERIEMSLVAEADIEAGIPSAAHDVWRRGGLGPLGRAICLHVQRHGPRTPTELGKALGAHPKSISKRLSRMAEHGVMASSNGCWSLVDEVDWDVVAFEMSTLWRGAKQRQRHEDEREGLDEVKTFQQLLDAGLRRRDARASTPSGAIYVDAETGEVLDKWGDESVVLHVKRRSPAHADLSADEAIENVRRLARELPVPDRGSILKRYANLANAAKAYTPEQLTAIRACKRSPRQSEWTSEEQEVAA